jgi:geranylgeranyl diphosphate synthase, type II
MTAFEVPRSFRRHREFVEAGLAGLELPSHGRVADGMRRALATPGKRVRPVAALLAADALGADPGQVLPFALAVECLHTASLILDDLPAMDDARERRGEPTLHREVGEADAILVATSLVSRAFALVPSAGPARRRGNLSEALIEVLDRALAEKGMCEGQSLDLAFAAEAAEFAELEAIHRLKTGALFVAAFEGTALIAKATEAEAAALVRYARNLGLAFQIADDVLDAVGNPGKMGKDLGGDAGRGHGFVELFGLSASQKALERLHRTAEDAIAPWGRRGEELIALARFLEHRES